jgi:hypothetical protein
MKKWLLLALSGALTSSLSAQTQISTTADLLGDTGLDGQDETLAWTATQMAAEVDWSSSTWRGWFPALMQSFEADSFTLIASTTDSGHQNMYTWAM